MEELGVDMEELESRLYGQVFHSSMENEEPPPHHEFQPNSNNNFRRPSRYFNLKTKAPKEKPQEFISLTSDNPVPEDLSSCPESEVFAGRYYDGISTVPQKLIRMIAPCNNIVVLPQVSTQIISQEVLPSVRSTNYEKYVSREHIRELKRIKKNEKNRRRREIRKQLKKLHLQEKEASKVQQEFLSNTVFLEHNMVTNTLSLEPERNDVITLSDSDVSDCVEIPERKELVVLSSDDENGINIKQEDGTNLRLKNIKTEVNLPDDYKLKNDDDVIFIEPEAKQIEVIEIDCDSINVSLKDDEKHSETTSTNSDNIKIPNIPSKRRLVAKELRELRTPDSSASNDFLDNTVDLNQSKFNFSLHGSDFRNTNTSKTKNVEVSETDSTTSDVTTAKANFFNVVEFETAPKHFFEDTNLETFGKYITPKRNNLKNVKDLNLEQVCTRASQCHIITAHDSSGSSSESDYDENKVSYLNSKRLPELSTVHIETELVDRDDSFVAEEISVEPKQMLKKNDAKRKSEDNDASNKKRKVQEDGANGNEDVTTVENVEQQLDCFTDDIEIGDHSDFIIIDETDDHDHIVENVSDDTGSYFSCDEFNNITSDLMLGNCRAEEYGNGDLKIDKTDYLNYSIEEIHRTMSDDPDLWKILDVDRLHFRYATPRGLRCHRCREVGHMALHCTNKQGRPACTLCGERTHAEPRCPMAMCTSCGRLGGHTTYCSYCAHWRNVQCNICKLYGHVDSVCPDAWRRYHLTTKPGPIVKPAVQTLKAEKDRWCSGCAQSGHFESACTHYNRTHYAVYPEVLHYVDLYNFPKLRPYIIHREDATTSDISSGKAKSLCTVKSSDQFMDVRDTDQDQTPFEDSFHDAETGSPDKRPSVDEQLKIEDSAVNEMYFTISFPPPNFIPAYFRCQMNYLKKQYLRNHKTLGNRVDTKNSADSLRDATSSSTRSGTSASLEEFIPLDNNNRVSQTNDASNRSEAKENYKIKGGPSVNQRKSGCNQSLKLDYLQFAYIHTDQGIHFFNNIRRKPGVHLIIEKYDETPAGEIYINGYSEANVVSIKKDIVQFLRSMPCINNLPQESKDMLQFLLRHKEMLDKAEGNCWTLCKKLCKLTNSGGRDGCTSSLVKLKINIQVTIQLLLFGKLKLENGGQHVNKIQEWIRTTRDRPNYIIPLNNIFEIYDSYSYLFEPRKSIFPYKHLCAQHDHYILPTNNSKRQKMPQRNRTYVENKSKFVMETCKKFNLPNKFMAELVAIQNAMQASKHSRTYYIDFLKFMSRFRKYMKKHKIL